MHRESFSNAPKSAKRGVFETRSRAPQSTAEIQQLRNAREAERRESPGMEHLHSVTDLHRWLEERGHVEACANLYRCDPWKYEPLLLDELYRLKTSEERDTGALNEVRGLIRAGSWMTYERLSDRDAIKELETVREREQADWLWKIRNADPDTAKEHAENRQGILSEIDQIEHDLHAGKNGEDLETTASTVESLMSGAWHELKKAIAIHGLSWDDVKKHPATRGLFEEIEALRPVRDLAYFRRLYPIRAKETGRH